MDYHFNGNLIESCDLVNDIGVGIDLVNDINFSETFSAGNFSPRTIKVVQRFS